MNKAEKKMLREVIFRVAHHNKYLWWELKRQIWDHGLQAYYPRQGDFDQTAERTLKALGTTERRALAFEWRKANAHQLDWSEERIVLSYVPVVIEEVVKRATTAAYRTTNW